jgi:hypothetical protein
MAPVQRLFQHEEQIQHPNRFSSRLVRRAPRASTRRWNYVTQQAWSSSSMLVPSVFGGPSNGKSACSLRSRIDLSGDEFTRHEFEWKREECFMIRKPDPPVLVAITNEPPGRIKTKSVQILDYNLNRFVRSAITMLDHHQLSAKDLTSTIGKASRLSY